MIYQRNASLNRSRFCIPETVFSFDPRHCLSLTPSFSCSLCLCLALLFPSPFHFLFSFRVCSSLICLCRRCLLAPVLVNTVSLSHNVVAKELNPFSVFPPQRDCPILARQPRSQWMAIPPTFPCIWTVPVQLDSLRVLISCNELSLPPSLRPSCIVRMRIVKWIVFSNRRIVWVNRKMREMVIQWQLIRLFNVPIVRSICCPQLKKNPCRSWTPSSSCSPAKSCSLFW